MRTERPPAFGHKYICSPKDNRRWLPRFCSAAPSPIIAGYRRPGVLLGTGYKRSQHFHYGLAEWPVVQLIQRSEETAPVRLAEKEKQLSTSTLKLVPPFTRETAILKVRKAEDLWNSRDPQQVALAYVPDSIWRNRSEFANGREEIAALLTRKWQHELEYRLIKELWAFGEDRIAVRFAYEYHDNSGQWYRAYGNENWEFNAEGIMHHRYASINDLRINDSERLYNWPLGRRPDDHPGLTELGL